MINLQYVKRLSEAFDSLSYDKIEFQIFEDLNYLVPKLVNEPDVTADDLINFFGETPSAWALKAFIAERDDTVSDYYSGDKNPNDSYFASFIDSKNPNKEWLVFTISDCSLVCFRIKINPTGLSAKVIMEHVIAKHGKCHSAGSICPFVYSPVLIQQLGIGVFNFYKLLEWWGLHPNERLIFLALYQFAGCPKSTVIGAMTYIMNSYVEPRYNNMKGLMTIVKDLFYQNELSKELIEAKWKSSAAILLRGYQNLFVTDDQKQVWQYMGEFCSDYKILSVDEPLPYYSAGWDKNSLNKLWELLTEEGYISNSFSLPEFRYVFGGGEGKQPTSKIEWKKDDDYSMLYALLDVFEQGNQHSWVKANKVFSTKTPLSSEGRSNKISNRNKEYMDNQKQKNPYEVHLEEIKRCKKSKK